MPLAKDQRYDWLLDEIRNYVQDALDVVIVREIKRTCIEMCERGQIWQVDHVGTAEGQPDPTTGEDWRLDYIPLPPPGDPDDDDYPGLANTLDGTVVDLRWLRVRGRTLTSVPLRALDMKRSLDEYGRYRSTHYGDPKEFSLDFANPSTHRFDPDDPLDAGKLKGESPAPADTSRTRALLWPGLVAEEEERYEARISLKPLWRAEGVPAHGLIEDYREAIVDGTLARLYKQANHPWSAPELSQLHQTHYEAALRAADARARGTTTGSALRVRYGGIREGYRIPRNRYGYETRETR